MQETPYRIVWSFLRMAPSAFLMPQQTGALKISDTYVGKEDGAHLEAAAIDIQQFPHCRRELLSCTEQMWSYFNAEMVCLAMER